MLGADTCVFTTNLGAAGGGGGGSVPFLLQLPTYNNDNATIETASFFIFLLLL